MISTRISKSWRVFVYSLAVTIVAATVVALVNRDVASGTVSAQGPSPEVVFSNPASVIVGTDLGPAAPGVPYPSNITVSGVTGSVTKVTVTLNNLTHTWPDDIGMLLVGPTGVKVRLMTDVGGPGNVGGGPISGVTLVFDDAAAASLPNSGQIVSGSFKPTLGTAGSGEGTAHPANFPAPAPAATYGLLLSAFNGVDPNGTWSLYADDDAAGDGGTLAGGWSIDITAAGGPTPTPTATPTATPVPPDTVSDFDGDGSTDYAVIRNPGGPSGQATWFVSLNASSNPVQRDWGLGSDTFIPADFDGDGKDDYAVWRAGAQGTFYIVNSSNNTITIDNFGVSGDDPSIVGDYNNDNRDDVAVYRSGATAGAQSFWYWKNAATGTIYAADWGLNGDFVAPGDYNGDNANDYAIQRTVGANSVFYVRISSGGPDQITTFGLANDLGVSADYDGDKKTDLAVVSANGANWRWAYRPSLGGADVIGDWGILATDYPTPGDYNGDGKADFAVWRPGALSTFHVIRPVTLQISSRQWGLNDDIPVNNIFAH